MGNVYLELTHQCNLRCPHCYNMSGDDCTELSQEILFSLFRAIGSDGTENWQIALSGGEPLMRKDISEILRECAKYSNIQVILLTNGIWLEKILDEFLICDHPIDIQVSLDGMSEDSNDFIRGKGSFIKTTQNIRKLVKAGYKGCNLKMTINKMNYMEVSDFVDFALKNDCIPRFSFLNRQGNAALNWEKLELSPEKKISVLNNLKSILSAREEEFKALDPKIDIISIIPVITVDCPLLHEESGISVSIKPNGDVQPCQDLYDAFFSIGNIYENDFNSIVDRRKNIRFRTVIDFLNNRRELLRINKCKDCCIKEKCGTGCPGKMLNETETLIDLDSFCGIRRGMVNIKMLKRKKMKNG